MVTENRSGLQPGLCDACGSRIFWVTMGSGQRSAVNPDPAWVVTIEPDLTAIKRDGYTSHSASCPAQNERKRPKKGGR